MTWDGPKRKQSRSGPAVLLIVGVIALLVLGWVVLRPDKAPHAREQAALAQQDSLWERVPSGQVESFRYTVLGDAAWVPWSAPVTGVGRYYAHPADQAATLAQWRPAATAAGWQPVARICQFGVETDFYTKRLGSWTATLTIGLNNTLSNLLVSVVFAATWPPDTAPPTCS